MKSIKDNTKLLVEQILNGNLLDANSTLASLVIETENQREDQIRHTIFEAEGDEEVEDVDDTAEEGDEEVEGGEEAVDTTDIDEPTDGDPSLGDNLDNSVEDAAVSEGEMTEMSNDVVEINCEINQKIISKLYDKISNLKTILNSKDMDHDTREYITLETKLSYYGNKLEELQSKTNPAIDQTKVEERITKIEAALASLESEIGSTSDVPEVEDSVTAAEGDVDDLGDTTETAAEGGEEEAEETAEGGEEAAEEGEAEETAAEGGEEEAEEEA